MTETNQNITMYQGDSKNIIVPVTDENGASLDLSGVTVKWGMREKEYSDTNIISKQSPTVTISGNEITVSLAPEDTQNLDGTYYHECEITDQQGDVSTIFTGTITIKKSGV